MSDAAIGLIGACIGGLAAIVGAWVQSSSAAKTTRLQLDSTAREATRRRRQELATRYLFGLQESTESLRRRLERWAGRGGKEMTDAVDPGYWEITTLYVVARPLAFERILALEGVYPALEADLPDLVEYLGDHGVEVALAEVLSGKLLRYHRQTLAEAALERQVDGFRVITYSEFRSRYEDPKSKLDLRPAESALTSLTPDEMERLETMLREIVDRLVEATRVPRKRFVDSDA